MKKIKFSKLVAVLAVVGIITSAGVLSANAAVIDSELGVTASFENFDNTDVSAAASASSSLPSKYSSVEFGYVTEIKNQGSNDCWAYAGISTFESKLLREGINIGNMSAQWANVWATTKLNGKGWQRNYNSDGYNDIIPGYLTSWYGGILESDIAPVDLNGDIYGDMAPSNLTKYGTTSIRYLSNTDPDRIKQSIMDNGGVYTAYAHTVNCMDENISYYMPASYSGTYTGHAVEIVGWDDNYSKDLFKASGGERPQNNGAWLVRNSWGVNYNSLGGYFWISYEDKYVFSTKYNPSFAIEEVMPITDDVKLKQNEIYGATYEFSYVLKDEITYINRFDFSDEYDVIDKVVFETKCAGADYEIYYIPVENEVPVNDESDWIMLDSGKVEFSGYICADFKDFSVPSDEGAVAVRIDTTSLNEGKSDNADSSYVINSLGVEEWRKIKGGDYTFINDSEYGESFIKCGGEMKELLDWYKDSLKDDMGGTFVIKAITRKDTQDYSMLGDVNLDGDISIDDVTLTQKYIANLEELSEQSIKNADIDGNSKIEIDDVTLIQKYIAGIYEW